MNGVREPVTSCRSAPPLTSLFICTQLSLRPHRTVLTMFRQPRYTVEITIHKAQHVPVGDILNVSCDPYICATLHPQNLTQGKPDGPPQRQVLEYRTRTVRSSLEPIFDCKWIVGGITESGFVLNLRLRDEDPGQFLNDDRLGKGMLRVPSLGEKLGER